MSRIRILIADEHLQVRAQVFARLVREPDFEIVAVADNSAQAVDCTFSTRPDIVLIDPMMHDGLGFEALRRIAARLRETALVVLTAAADTTQKMQLREVGACQILNKGIASGDLIAILRQVAQKNTASQIYPQGATPGCLN